MTKSEIQKIEKELSKTLDSKRYEHTMAVAYTAACLAMRYDYDITKAYIAGLLHDCAKCMSHEERLDYCNNNNIFVSDVERVNPALLHAKVGAHLCHAKYHIHDEDIRNSICYHTTGHPNMTLLEKIIYIADYIEPNRTKIPNLSLVRKQVFCDIDTALFIILKDNIAYLNQSGKAVDPMTLETYMYYIKQE